MTTELDKPYPPPLGPASRPRPGPPPPTHRRPRPKRPPAPLGSKARRRPPPPTHPRKTAPAAPTDRLRAVDWPASTAALPDVPVDDDTSETGPGRFRRALQGSVLVAVVVAAVGLAVVLPDDDSEPGARLRADGPTAAASLSGAGRAVDGELVDSGPMGEGTATLPADPEPLAVASGGLAQYEQLITTTTTSTTAPTTTWVEPSLPPESEWVDTGNGVLVPDVLLRIRFCESTNDYDVANGTSSARGAYQFLKKSWEWYGHAALTGTAEAHLATPAQQDRAALRTLQAEGTGPWAESRPCWADPDIDPAYATAGPPSVAAEPTTTTTVSPTTTSTTADTTTTTVDTTPSTTEPSTTTTTDPSTTTEPSTTTTTDPSTTTTS